MGVKRRGKVKETWNKKKRTDIPGVAGLYPLDNSANIRQLISSVLSFATLQVLVHRISFISHINSILGTKVMETSAKLHEIS